MSITDIYNIDQTAYKFGSDLYQMLIRFISYIEPVEADDSKIVLDNPINFEDIENILQELMKISLEPMHLTMLKNVRKYNTAIKKISQRIQKFSLSPNNDSLLAIVSKMFEYTDQDSTDKKILDFLKQFRENIITEMQNSLYKNYFNMSMKGLFIKIQELEKIKQIRDAPFKEQQTALERDRFLIQWNRRIQDICFQDGICPSCGKYYHKLSPIKTSGIYYNLQCPNCSKVYTEKEFYDQLQVFSTTQVLMFSAYNLGTNNYRQAVFASKFDAKYEREYYVDRPDIDPTLDDFFEGMTAPQKVFLLLGKAGLGKTWYVVNFALQLQDEGFPVFFFPLRNSLKDQLYQTFNLKDDQLYTVLFNTLNKIPAFEAAHITFIFDGYDEMETDEEKKYFLALLQKYAELPYVKIIVTARYDDWQLDPIINQNRTKIINPLIFTPKSVSTTQKSNPEMLYSAYLKTFTEKERDLAIEKFQLPPWSQWDEELKKFAQKPYWIKPIYDRYKSLGYLPTAYDMRLLYRYLKRMGFVSEDIRFTQLPTLKEMIQWWWDAAHGLNSILLPKIDIELPKKLVSSEYQTLRRHLLSTGLWELEEKDYSNQKILLGESEIALYLYAMLKNDSSEDQFDYPYCTDKEKFYIGSIQLQLSPKIWDNPKFQELMESLHAKEKWFKILALANEAVLETEDRWMFEGFEVKNDHYRALMILKQLGILIADFSIENYEIHSLRLLDIAKSGKLYEIIQHLGTSPALVQSLKTLNLSDNGLRTMPDNISLLVYLDKLNLADNMLTTLPEGIGQLSSLQKLILENNQLSSLPKGFEKLGALTILNMNGNKFSSIPEEVGHLKNLQLLSLENNDVNVIPKALKNLSRLAFLNLRNNPKLGKHSIELITYKGVQDFLYRL